MKGRTSELAITLRVSKSGLLPAGDDDDDGDDARPATTWAEHDRRAARKARKAERAARRQAEGDQNIQLEEEFRTLGVK